MMTVQTTARSSRRAAAVAVVAAYTQFHSDSASNSSGYGNDEMDAALEEGRRSTDEAARAAAYSTAQRLLAEEVPVYEYASSPWGWVVAEGVHGVVALPGSEPIPGRIFIEPEG